MTTPAVFVFSALVISISQNHSRNSPAKRFTFNTAFPVNCFNVIPELCVAVRLYLLINCKSLTVF